MNETYQAYRRRLRTVSQRKRRQKLIRIDFYDVDPEVKALLDANHYGRKAGSRETYSQLLNRIVLEWAGGRNGG